MIDTIPVALDMLFKEKKRATNVRTYKTEKRTGDTCVHAKSNTGLVISWFMSLKSL